MIPLGRPLSPETPLKVVKMHVLEHLVEKLGGRVRLGRFLQVRFVWDRNGFPDVPDDMTLGTFQQHTLKGETKIIIDDEGGGGGRALAPSPVPSDYTLV